MKAIPILFSGPMVRALLAGTKTQTRRAISRQLKHPGWTEYAYFGPSKNNPTCKSMAIECGPDYPDDDDDVVLCPYGAVGDLLWVRESWQYAPSRFCRCPQGAEPSPCDDWVDGTGCASDRSGGVLYRADGGSAARWRPSIHMPRWASRLTLRITEIRVQQLRDISSDDARAEGVEWDAGGWRDYSHSDGRRKSSAQQSFLTLWESINGADSLKANPWVWAITFEVIKANVDVVHAQMREAV